MDDEAEHLEYVRMCDLLWEANRGSQARVAEASFRACPLVKPHADVPGLDRLLADVQMRSFYLGAIAALSVGARITDVDSDDEHTTRIYIQPIDVGQSCVCDLVISSDGTFERYEIKRVI